VFGDRVRPADELGRFGAAPALAIQRPAPRAGKPGIVRPRGRQVQRRVDVACGADGSHTWHRTDALLVVSDADHKARTRREPRASAALSEQCNLASAARRSGGASRESLRPVSGCAWRSARSEGRGRPGPALRARPRRSGPARGCCASRPRRVGGAMRPGRCVSAKTAPEARPAAQARFRRRPAGDPVAQPMAHRPADYPSRRGHRQAIAAGAVFRPSAEARPSRRGVGAKAPANQVRSWELGIVS
jgi:hypothetical protein